MLEEPTPEERRRAGLVVKMHARDDHDEAELMAMLGLDRIEPPPAARKPPGVLSPAEVHDLLAPFAAERGAKPDRARSARASAGDDGSVKSNGNRL